MATLLLNFVFQVVLSPIQELDGSGSVNNTLHAHSPGTAALAQAVLSPTLGPLLTNPVNLPVSVSQLAHLGFHSARSSPIFPRSFEGKDIKNPTFTRAFEPDKPVTPLTLTELAGGETPDGGRTPESDVPRPSRDDLTGESDGAKLSRQESDKGSASSPNSLTSVSSSEAADSPKRRKLPAVPQPEAPPKRGEVYV